MQFMMKHNMYVSLVLFLDIH